MIKLNESEIDIVLEVIKNKGKCSFLCKDCSPFLNSTCDKIYYLSKDKTKRGEGTFKRRVKKFKSLIFE